MSQFGRIAMRMNRKGNLMQVTNFKTYSSKNVRKAIEKLQLNTLGSSDINQLRKSSHKPVKILPIQEYSLKLNKRIQDNRNKLIRNPKSKSRFKVRPEVLKALLGDNMESKNTEISVKSLPLKQYSNQDAFRLRDRQRNVLKYLSNDKDPYFQLRHNNYLTIRY